MTTTHGASTAGRQDNRTRRSRRDVVLLNGERFGLVALMILVFAFFTFWGKTSDVFDTSANLNNIVGNQAVLALVALAAIVPLICGEFDLSVGSTLGIGAIVSAKLFADTSMPFVVCLIAPALAGAVIGMLNGLLVTRLGVNPLITTLGVATVLGGIATWITSGQPIVQGVPDSLTTFGSSTTAGLPNTLWVLVVGAVAVWFLIEQTPFGRHMYGVGTNAAAARLVGLPVQRIVLCSFVMSGVIAGLAGGLLLSRSGSGDPQIGFNFTLPALAAAFLGATAIKPGRFNVVGTLVAIFFLAMSVSGLTLAGSEPYVQDLFNGAALIVGVAVSTLIARQRLRAPKRSAEDPVPS